MSSQRYSPGFKDEAVRQITERGYSVADVAERLGVSAHNLYKWVKPALREEVKIQRRTNRPPPQRSRRWRQVGETCRKYGISQPTYYAWRSKYAGMEVSQLRRMKELETEHAKLKRMYAELAIEHHALKDVMSKKF